MRIVLIGFGSRGDVQPLLALGCGLQSAGHDVSIAAAANFQSLIETAGLNYAFLRTDMQAVMNSDSGKEWIENSSDNSLKEARNMHRMIDEVGTEVMEDFLRVSQDAELLLSGLASYGMMQAIAEKFGKRHTLALFAPLHPTASHAATMVPIVPRTNIFLNRASGYIGQYFMYWIFKEVVNQFRESIGLKPQIFRDYTRTLRTSHPVIYGVSPHVMPRPDDWDDHIHVSGYWFYDDSQNWQPPQALQGFLDAGTPPVYMGFGSMANKNPQATTAIMIDALRQAGQRGIIHSGWAGLQSDDLPDDMFLLDYAPHDWLFPRMAAVIHHGGAGTTAAALRAGVPSSVIAHMADQPYWGNRVHQLGVGGALIRRHQLTTARLAAVIRQITSDAATKDRAQALANKIRQEDGVANAVRILTQK